MNMDKNIIYGKTLSEYKRKYRNCKRNLLFYSKEEVETFDAKFSKSAQVDKVLLQGRKWAYINGTYYEIPKSPSWTWFRNLNSTVQVFTCGLLGAGVVTAVVVPTVIAINKNSGQLVVLDKIEIEEEPTTNKFYFGESYTSKGLKVNAVYSDSSKKDVTDKCSLSIKEGYVFEEDDTGKEHDVTVKYEDKTVTYKFKVVALDDYLKFDNPEDPECNTVKPKEDAVLPKNLIIPNKLNNKTIKSIYGFDEKDIESVDLSKTEITQIYDSTFGECSKLKKIILSNGLEKIGNSMSGNVFSYCSELEEIDIPSKCKYFYPKGAKNFIGCNKLNTVVLDSQDIVDTVLTPTKTGDITLFDNASAVYIKNGLTKPTPEKYIFDNFTEQDSSEKEGYTKWVTNKFVFTPIDDKTYSISGVQDATYADDLYLPSNNGIGLKIIDIPEKAFSSFQNIKNIILSKHIESIGREAFCPSSLVKIKLNDGLKSIGESAFAVCENLEEINIPSSLSVSGLASPVVFTGSDKLATIVLDNQTFVDTEYEVVETLYKNAKTIYIKEGLTDPTSGYIFDNFTKQGTSDREGYSKWTKNH